MASVQTIVLTVDCFALPEMIGQRASGDNCLLECDRRRKSWTV